MKHVPLRRTLVAAAVLVAAMIGSASAVTASAAVAPSCGITWGSLPRAGDTLGSAALLDVRTGQHDCYDRVVFDFNGPASGYGVGYASQVVTQGSGSPLDVTGGARLGVVLLANDHDIETGARTFPHAAGDHVASVTGYRALRDVVYGGSFEGRTTFGVGVRARLPFRVVALAGPGAHSRIVVDIAHRWES